MFLFAIVNANPIQLQQVTITNLNMEQYKTIVEQSQHVWIIQLCYSNSISKEFTKAAFVYRGVAKAGIIHCSIENKCNAINNGQNIPDGTIVFIHNGVVSVGSDETIDNFKLIRHKTKDLIDEKLKNQEENIEEYKIKTVEFSIENF